MVTTVRMRCECSISSSQHWPQPRLCPRNWSIMGSGGLTLVTLASGADTQCPVRQGKREELIVLGLEELILSVQ